LILQVPDRVEVGQTFTIPLLLEANGQIQGLSIPLTWDAERVKPVGYAAGDLLREQGGPALVLSPNPGVLDISIFGRREMALAGQGVLATVTFEAIATGDPSIGVGAIIARDADNKTVTLATETQGSGGGGTEGLPRFSLLQSSYPNPFNPRTTLEYGVARAGQVTIKLYSLDGRLVRTLVNERMEPGSYQVIWDGTSNGGARVASGTYLVLMKAPDRTDTRCITLVK
jgi:hypothetical protein